MNAHTSRTLVDQTTVLEAFTSVRNYTERLAQPLSAEDQTIQSMPDVSPTKWHRAHTTWFFEQFVLGEFSKTYAPYDEHFAVLFNSYYETVGSPFPRSKRGLISRPGVGEVSAYRAVVDDAVERLFEHELSQEALTTIELGAHHEQQHQELLLMDIKHVLSIHPQNARYVPPRDQLRDSLDDHGSPIAAADVTTKTVNHADHSPTWTTHAGGVVETGLDTGFFGFDNERPRHNEYLNSFELADQLVTCGEWQAFIEDGGYLRSELWLSDGWNWVNQHQIEAPLYWDRQAEHPTEWERFSLFGTRAIDPAEPLCHVSHYEADAYARWANARLPTEFEWEHAVSTEKHQRSEFNAQSEQPLEPTVATSLSDKQFFGNVWQWTSSAYLGYPGYVVPRGAIGEYNGKFMSNQMVLRGSSSATPNNHSRATYRNFFPPSARWCFSGLRLCRS